MQPIKSQTSCSHLATKRAEQGTTAELRVAQGGLVCHGTTWCVMGPHVQVKCKATMRPSSYVVAGACCGLREAASTINPIHPFKPTKLIHQIKPNTQPWPLTPDGQSLCWVTRAIWCCTLSASLLTRHPPCHPACCIAWYMQGHAWSAVLHLGWQKMDASHIHMVQHAQAIFAWYTTLCATLAHKR
jgi:hypothetical protein